MNSIMSTIRVMAGAAAIAVAFPSVGMAWQTGPAPPAAPESVTVALGKRYQAGTFHRWLVGGTYRDMWAMPIRVPVLDWHTYAGGLHPTKEGGGMQTKSLRFETVDGVEYVFRLSDKGATGAPGPLKNTPADAIFQDQVSTMHPAGAEIAAPILEASGVMHPTAVLVMMPDDSALGRYRKDFAGRMGMIEEYPNVPKHGPGFDGATKIIDSPELLKLLNTDAREHVDARAFLTARLTDFLLGDNDRHAGQWKWARLESGSRTQWEPIARDRDHAFVSYDGILLRLARMAAPTLVTFGNVPNVSGLTQPEGFDARLLTGLGKPVWDSVALALQARITDAVISAAAHATPIEYQGSAPELEAMLKSRRAALPSAADQFYRLLAARAEIHGTDAPDRAVITRLDDGSVDVRVEAEGKPFFSRRFDPRETSEILVYLHGGDDTALVTGHACRSIRVRAIGGNGINTFIDSYTVDGNRRPTQFHDAGTVGGVSYGLDTLFDRRPWEEQDGKLAPPGPDHGLGYTPVMGLSAPRRIGITPRLGLVRYGYGFDDRPYSYMIKVEGEYATQFQGGRVGVTVDKRLESSTLHFTAHARVSDFEVVNFGGLGNASIDSGGTDSYFEVHQRQWLLHPAIALAVGSNLDISLGPVFQRSVTDSVRSPYLLATHPYGFGTFNQAALQLGARYELRPARTDEEHSHHEVLVELSGLYFPAMMDVRSAFEEAAATVGASSTLPLPTHPFLVVRAGGKKLYGDFPFFEAATIGGMGTMRYMDTQRYAGDASLFATSELRVPVVRFHLIIPVRAGILGIAESGRVYDATSSPGGWHSRTGEGIWFGTGTMSPVLTLLRTTEFGHGGFHFGLGLNF